MRAAGLEIKIKIKIKTLGSFPFHAAYAPTPAVHATVATALNEADSSDHMEADMLLSAAGVTFPIPEIPDLEQS